MFCKKKNKNNVTIKSKVLFPSVIMLIHYVTLHFFFMNTVDGE